MREFDKQLKSNLESFISMIEIVKNMVPETQKALYFDQDFNIEDIKSRDKKVDALENTIEAECLKLIALHQPVATDLRQLGFCLKSLADVERMGDYMVHVTEYAKIIDKKLLESTEINKMLDVCYKMTSMLIEALQEKDLNLAQKALLMDNAIDNMYNELEKSLIFNIQNKPEEITSTLEIIKIARAIERFGDHIENIAERFPYWLMGQKSNE